MVPGKAGSGVVLPSWGRCHGVNRALPIHGNEMGPGRTGSEQREESLVTHRTVSQAHLHPASLWSGLGARRHSRVWRGARCRHPWGPLPFAAIQGRPSLSQACPKEFPVSGVEGCLCGLSWWGKTQRGARRGLPRPRSTVSGQF